MRNIFVKSSDGQASPVPREYCKNEESELQGLLAGQLDILPGDQIDPKTPRQWLLVGREVAVPDPKGGSDRWSLDLLLADQDATPTLVECKRFEDTRSRRLVVAQMLDYAANGHHGKQASDFLALARAANPGLEDALLGIEAELEVDEFFQRFLDKFRDGEVRLVFFLEESPPELRSLVDFLNEQMTKAEVLLVEAGMYDLSGGIRVIVPRLFGYTEEARVLKKATSKRKATGKRQWDWASYHSELKAQRPEAAESVADVVQHLERLGGVLSYGSGEIWGNVRCSCPRHCPTYLFSFYTNGILRVRLESMRLQGCDEVLDRFMVWAVSSGLPRLDKKFPELAPAEWLPHVDSFKQLLTDVFQDESCPPSSAES